MIFHTKYAVIGSIGTIAVGYLAYLMHKNKKKCEEGIMEVYFTNGKCEEHTKNVEYLGISELDSFPKNMRRIEEYIDAATKTIDIAMYSFTVIQLGEAIIRAYERGVSVRIVGCKGTDGFTGTQFGKLNDKGITVHIKDTTILMHHKFCLIDTRDQTEKEKEDAKKRVANKNRKNIEEATETDQNLPKKPIFIPKQGVCITGSVNWTMEGFCSNWENLIIMDNRYVVAEFRKEFDKIYDDFLKSQKVNVVKHRNG